MNIVNVNKLKYMFRLGLLFGAALISQQGIAASAVRYYDIELIVFETPGEDGQVSETWRPAKELEVPEQFITLGAPYPGKMPDEFDARYTFVLLPAASHQLKDQAKALTEKGNNRILLHTAWRQPGMPQETALPVRFKYRFRRNSSAGASDVTSTIATQANPPVQSNLPVQNNQPAIAGTTVTEADDYDELDGLVKIILSRYLHADIQLRYSTLAKVIVPVVTAEPGTDQEKVQPAIQQQWQKRTYPFAQTRKMRSKEIHYLDHPAIGVLILATPYLGHPLR